MCGIVIRRATCVVPQHSQAAANTWSAHARGARTIEATLHSSVGEEYGVSPADRFARSASTRNHGKARSKPQSRRHGTNCL